MAIRKSNIKKSVPVVAAVQFKDTIVPEETPKQRTAYSKSKEEPEEKKRAKLIVDGFHPTAVAFLKDNFGIDLYDPKFPLASIYDIKEGRVTAPLEMICKPEVYDRVNKKIVTYPGIRVVASMRFVFPYDNHFKPVALDADNHVAVYSYPCHEFVKKAEPSYSEKSVVPVEHSVDEKMPVFSVSQVMALESVGIKQDRLFSKSFNALPLDVKRDILAGKAFDVDGSIRTAVGNINIAGTARMVTVSDKEVRTKFEPRYAVTQKNDDILDLMAVRRNGSVEFDFFERDQNGHVRTDVYDKPIVNKAGRDLVLYGVSMEPVYGYSHKNEFKNNLPFDNVEKERYQVSVVNGGLCATKMKKVMEYDKDGKQLLTKVDGKDQPKYHYEVADLRINKDNTVRVGKDDLKFVSEKDLDNYRRGLGGTVVGAKWHNFASKEVVSYDAFVVPDNQRNGFAKAFSPATSEKIRESRTAKMASVKKQNFSLGF
jgi:hypothetical protein